MCAPQEHHDSEPVDEPVDGHFDGPTEEIDARVDAYLAALLAGEQPDLNVHAAQIEDRAARAEFRARALAAEVLWRREEDERFETERFLRERCESESEQARLRELVAAADEAFRVLPRSAAPGAVVAGRYELGRRLGKGGVGEVYEALDRELGRHVALKLVAAESSGDAAALEHGLHEESRTLASLDSPHVVTVHDVLREGDRVFVVLALVHGVSLGEAISRLAKARATPRERLALLRGIAGAPARGAGALAERTWHRAVAALVQRLASVLARAWDKGVLHRDIKPHNVMLGADGEPVLLDFGLAWRVNAQDDGRKFQGTPEYLAPEQIEAAATGNDPRSDVYALGLVAYELLALRRAFERGKHELLHVLFERIRKAELQPLDAHDPRIPLPLLRIVERAIASDPAKRYADMKELALDLERWLQGRAPVHASIPLHARAALAGRRAVRSPLVLAAAAALVAWGGFTATRADVAHRVEGFWYVDKRADAPAPVSLGPLEEVPGSAWLGVTVSGTDAQSAVYLFQAWRDAGSDADPFVRRVPALRLEDGEPVERLGPGTHHLLGTSVEVGESHPLEGLAVILVDEHDPRVGELIDLAMEQDDVELSELLDALRATERGGPIEDDPDYARVIRDVRASAGQLSRSTYQLQVVRRE